MQAKKGGGPFGAVVVCDGQVVGRGHNRVTEQLDPTAHAEIIAIREACRTFGRFDLSGCELYTSCEPCPMCLAAIYWARLDRVFYACTRHDAAEIGFRRPFYLRTAPARDRSPLAADGTDRARTFARVFPGMGGEAGQNSGINSRSF